MTTYIPSHLRDMNRLRVFQLIKRLGVTSKAEISKLTGISGPTVMKIVDFLQEKMLVEEIGEAETAIGRRPHMIQINSKRMYAACFVLEGDFLNMGIVDILERVVYQKSLRVEADYHLIMNRIRENLVDELLEESGIGQEKLFGIGIALPVIYNKAANSISGAPLINRKAEFRMDADMERLGQKYGAMVLIENDTNAQALGEFHGGQYDALSDLLFISAGTGIGAGLILNGKLRRGNRYRGGEIGDMNIHSVRMENMIGHREIENKFGVNVIYPQEPLRQEQVEEIIHFIASPLAECIHNLNACLDCQNIVLGGKMIETLGIPLVDRINALLTSRDDFPYQVRMEQSESVGLTGMGWLLTNKKTKEILMEDT